MNWPSDWIKTAENLVRDQWKHYKPATPTAVSNVQPGPSTTTTATSHTVRSSIFTSGARLSIPFQVTRRQPSNRFARLDQWGRTGAAVDVLEEYLLTPCDSDVSDPIMHWHGVLMSSSSPEKKAFAQMCLDFLSAPASSTDVERAFSDESTRAATILSSWASMSGLIPEEHILQVFRDKCKRPKKGKESLIEAAQTVINVDD